LIKKSDTEFEGTCLVTGKKGKIARLHPAIKGVRGTNTTGGSIVSFNLDSFNSFSKKQNFNAPIGEDIAFAYTTALNTLLGKDSSNKTFSGDTSILFWTEKNTGQEYDIEENFSWFLSDPPKDDPDRGSPSCQRIIGCDENRPSARLRR
jgi:CRISPR-associated protein Csd1